MATEKCPIALPQDVPKDSDCHEERQSGLLDMQSTYRLKTSPVVPPFPLLDMTPDQLFDLLLHDTFAGPVMVRYLRNGRGSKKILDGYLNKTIGIPISGFQEYKEMRDFFRKMPQTVLPEVEVSRGVIWLNPC